ncbi:MAG: ferritin-like domain-containing protein [Acidobacteriota bacterium]
MTENGMTDHDRWLISFYRESELAGALFFGRLARHLPAGPLQVDMTRHFAEESQHAWLWSRCLDELGGRPMNVAEAYQARYVAAAGLPANLLEVLAVTHVFEARVIGQYSRHLHVEGVHPLVADTLRSIMEDERWHLQWVGEALEVERRAGREEEVDAALARFRQADQEVYREHCLEHDERLAAVLGAGAAA